MTWSVSQLTVVAINISFVYGSDVFAHNRPGKKGFCKLFDSVNRISAFMLMI